LGHATRAANSSKAAAAQNFWRLLKKVRSPGIFLFDFGMGQKPILHILPIISHIWGNNHQLTIDFRVLGVRGF